MGREGPGHQHALGPPPALWPWARALLQPSSPSRPLDGIISGLSFTSQSWESLKLRALWMALWASRGIVGTTL